MRESSSYHPDSEEADGTRTAVTKSEEYHESTLGW